DDIHEGTLVHTVAFLLHGAYSNTSNGESVNCGEHGAESNDIHLALAKTKTESDECNSFTAEVTPHFRPAEWGRPRDVAQDVHQDRSQAYFRAGSGSAATTHRPNDDGRLTQAVHARSFAESEADFSLGDSSRLLD